MPNNKIMKQLYENLITIERLYKNESQKFKETFLQDSPFTEFNVIKSKEKTNLKTTLNFP